MIEQAGRTRRGVTGLCRRQRMGSRWHHRGDGLRRCGDRRDAAHDAGAWIEKHSDSDGVSRVLEKGSGAGVGHRAGVTPTNRHPESDLSWPTSTHAARGFIMAALPNASAMELSASEGDPRGRSDEPPVLAVAQPVEGGSVRAIRVAAERAARLESGFGAVLDGTQDVRVVNHCGGIPIVWAPVSAAVRVRRRRKLVTWERERQACAARYYVPFRYLDDLPARFRADSRVVDTAEPDAKDAVPSRHPAALLERAILKVQQDREALEQQLAEAWCASESSTLYVDGSITASRLASTSPLAVGVIKSHRTLYAEGDAFRIIFGLQACERSCEIGRA